MQIHTNTKNMLREERMKCDYTYKRIARYLELRKPQLIARWETGESVPTLENVFKLAALYHLDPRIMYYEMYQKINNRIQAMKDQIGFTPVLNSIIPRSNFKSDLSNVRYNVNDK